MEYNYPSQLNMQSFKVLLQTLINREVMSGNGATTFAFPRLQQIIEQQSRLTHVTLFSGYDIFFFFSKFQVSFIFPLLSHSERGQWTGSCKLIHSWFFFLCTLGPWNLNPSRCKKGERNVKNAKCYVTFRGPPHCDSKGSRCTPNTFKKDGRGRSNNPGIPFSGYAAEQCFFKVKCVKLF